MKVIRNIRNGRERRVDDRLAAALVGLGGFAYVAAMIQAETASKEPEQEETEISERTGKPKRKYRRRDMQAED